MDELKDLLSGVEGAEGLADKIGEFIENKIDGLVRKNKELLGEIKNVKRKASENPDLDNLKDENEELRAKIETMTKEWGKKEKTYAQEIETLSGKLKAETESITRLVVDNGLTDALIKASVEEKHIPILREFHKRQVTLTEDTREPVYQAQDGSKPLGEYIKAWAETDGKDYVKAPAHSGGPIIGTASRGVPQKDAAKEAYERGDKLAYASALFQPKE